MTYPVPVDLSYGDFQTLLHLCSRFRIPIFIPQLCVAEFSQKKKSELPQKASRVRRQLRLLHNAIAELQEHSGASVNVPWLQEEIELPEEELIKAITVRVRSNLRKTGITIVKNAHVAQHRLIYMAVRKIRPFEQEGEKGFRDTIILYTMVQHAQGLVGQGKYVLFVSNDGVFDHADVKAFTTKQKVEVIRVGSLADAVSHVQAASDEDEQAALAARSERLRNFLLHQDRIITDFIRQEVRTHSAFFSEGWMTLGKPAEINEIKLADIPLPSPVFLPDGSPEGDVDVSFRASLKIDVTFQRFGMSAFEENIPLREGVIPGSIFPPPTEISFVTEKRTLDRDVGVEATLHLREGNPEEYSNLRPKHARVPSTVLNAVLRRLSPAPPLR